MRDIENSVTQATHSDTKKGDVASFCVIGPTVNSSFGRTWKTSKDDAISHAQKLIKNSHDGGRSKIVKLFVVQVVAVVETAGPPMTVRQMEEDDVLGE